MKKKGQTSDLKGCTLEKRKDAHLARHSSGKPTL